MDIHDLRYRRCGFCHHFFMEHYTTYTASPQFRGTMGCSVAWLMEGQQFVPPEELSMEYKLRKCPCPGWMEVIELDEMGNVRGHQVQQPNA